MPRDADSVRTRAIWRAVDSESNAPLTVMLFVTGATAEAAGALAVGTPRSMARMDGAEGATAPPEGAAMVGMLWDHPLMDYLEKTLNIKGLDRYHSACGGVVISRQAFINAYLKVQDIDWVEISKMDKYVSRYSDAIISYLLLFNKCKWSSWDQWSQGGYKDFVAYEKPIIHNIKYWYRHNIEDLDKINSQDNVKFFLENNS